jgi:hypothetical protein
MNGKTLSTYTISANRMYFTGAIDLQSAGKVIFTVTDNDGNIVNVNGAKVMNLEVGGNKYLYRASMYTSNQAG